MPILWTESLTLRLLNLYSNHECLRNPFHRNFKDKYSRYKAYRDIVDRMNVPSLTVSDCIKKITYIKIQYCYELSKISAAISCEKFYKPIASWFPIIHRLFFPFIPCCTCAYDIYGINNKEADLFEGNQYCKTYVSCTKTKIPRKDCNCPYAIHDHDLPYKTKSRTREKIPYTQIKDEECTTSLNSDSDCSCCSFLRSKEMIDVGNNTINLNQVHGTQTDVSLFKTVCTSCQVSMENDMSINSDNRHTLLMKNGQNMSDYQDCTLTENNNEVKGKAEDEFDMFSKSIAFQLQMAIKLEKRIQDLITRERLDNLKSKYSDYDVVCSSSECEISTKEMICSCGLPVIMIKADSSCNLECKHRK